MSARSSATRVARRAAAEPHEIAPLRRCVAGLARTAGFAPERVDDVALAVSEVLTNVVVHAYRDGDGHGDGAGPVELQAAIDGDQVFVTIADQGGGFARRDDSPGLGLGLAIARMIADELDISRLQPSGTLVALRFDRDGGAGYVDAG
jgi:anti-sigma regulatory factor (Ser/Thr protein kinase)